MLKDHLETEEEIQLDEELELDDEISSSSSKIYTEQGDPEIDSLYRKWQKGRLNVQPSFQRQFVWDKVKSSRLIESALLGIPLPIIYLSEEQDGKENVIDGQQRLTSFFSFIQGKFPDGADFKLSGLKVKEFEKLNGSKYSDLSEELQDRIRDYKIRIIKFKKESDRDLQFEIFSRLNTGSVPLNNQELRNCIYRGSFNELLKELAKNDDFRYLLGISTPDKRMNDCEFVLRFAAFHFNTYLRYKAPIKNFLNHTMEKYQHISEADAESLKKSFKNAVSIIRSLLDKNAFKRYYKGDDKNKNGKWETQKFNVSLYDIMMYSFAQEDKNNVYQNLDRIREALIDLMTDDQEFIDAIELSTSSVKAVTTRFDKWRLTLQMIIGVGVKEPRCFTYALKEKLYQNDNTCTICGNQIKSIDDAAIDHIKQYWTGGKTIPENARLTHRYCNNARKRIETDTPELSNNANNSQQSLSSKAPHVGYQNAQEIRKAYSIGRYGNPGAARSVSEIATDFGVSPTAVGFYVNYLQHKLKRGDVAYTPLINDYYNNHPNSMFPNGAPYDDENIKETEDRYKRPELRNGPALK